jgi:hypothetical protein
MTIQIRAREVMEQCRTSNRELLVALNVGMRTGEHRASGVETGTTADVIARLNLRNANLDELLAQ